MGSPTVIPRTDPRARTLLGVCLTLCCGYFILEMVGFLLFEDQLGNGALRQILSQRNSLFGLGLESQPAMKFVGEVEKWLQVPVDPVLVFNHPTIRELAGALARLDPRSIGG